MPDLRPLSFSQIALYFKCGEQYRRRYVERERTPPSPSLIAGTAVHAAAEAYYRAKRDQGVELGADQVRDAAATAFDQRVAQDGVLLDAEEAKVGRDQVLADAKDKAVRLATLHRAELAPTVVPDLIEERIAIEIPGLRRPLVAVVDLAAAPESDDAGGDIVDLKTASKRMSQDDADRSLQLTVYDVAYEALRGRRARRVVLHVLVDNKKPVADTLVSTRTDDDRHALAEYLAAAEHGIDAGIFLPAAPGAWWCSERFCAYARDCAYYPRNRLSNGG